MAASSLRRRSFGCTKRRPPTFVWGVLRCQIRCTCIYQRPRGRSRVIPPGASPPKAHVADSRPPARPAHPPPSRPRAFASHRVSDQGFSAQRACTAFETRFLKREPKPAITADASDQRASSSTVMLWVRRASDSFGAALVTALVDDGVLGPRGAARVPDEAGSLAPSRTRSPRRRSPARAAAPLPITRRDRGSARSIGQGIRNAPVGDPN
jgi:hypothetical protein